MERRDRGAGTGRALPVAMAGGGRAARTEAHCGVVGGEKVFKVDSHTHLLPSNGWPDTEGVDLRFVLAEDAPFSARLEWASDGRLFRKLKRNAFDADSVIAECDATGVDVQVVCTVPVMFNYHLQGESAVRWSRFLNDDLAATCAARASRMVGLGTLPLQDPAAAVAELRRCVTELGLRGVQVGSHVDAADPNGHRGRRIIPLSAPELRPVWEEAERLGAAVLVHPWDMEWWCDNKYWLPWLVGMPAETAAAGAALVLGGVLARYPGLKVMLSHGGGALPFLAGRLDWGHKCRPDLVAVDTPGVAPREGIRRLYLDSITHDRDALKFLIDFMGHERVMLGSDYPFPLGEVFSVAPGTGERLEVYPGHLIESSGMPVSVIKRLLGGTALEWLGMAEANFGRAGETPAPAPVGANSAADVNGDKRPTKRARVAANGRASSSAVASPSVHSFVANAFVTARGGAYSGNPAAVVLVPRGRPLSDARMLAVAAQMNLSETAFVTPSAKSANATFEECSHFDLRWFTPTVEVNLCGHATMATAAALAQAVGNSSEVLKFDTLSGELRVSISGNGSLELDLPSNPPESIEAVDVKLRPQLAAAALSIGEVITGEDQPLHTFEYSTSTKKLLVRLGDRQAIEALDKDLPARLLSAHDGSVVKGVIVTASDCLDEEVDFVSRYFAPWVGIGEDPVTGSAHTVLAPYWSATPLRGPEFRASQLSARGGDLRVRDEGSRVVLAGRAAVVSRCELVLPP